MIQCVVIVLLQKSLYAVYVHYTTALLRHSHTGQGYRTCEYLPVLRHSVAHPVWLCRFITYHLLMNRRERQSLRL